MLAQGRRLKSLQRIDLSRRACVPGELFIGKPRGGLLPVQRVHAVFLQALATGQRRRGWLTSFVVCKACNSLLTTP